MFNQVLHFASKKDYKQKGNALKIRKLSNYRKIV